ncbi:MAG: hypothetical protein IPF51_12155 [Dehalococcoidia bacterium]|uniref:hypothetical protein n=1 Tax=Candidatus Amarobacter glycogenicus TaxID=3140699 RepID=UPI003136A5BE|nr:hypothetical protein [Dehalococcoidia bacterium]
MNSAIRNLDKPGSIAAVNGVAIQTGHFRASCDFRDRLEGGAPGERELRFSASCRTKAASNFSSS